MGLLYYSNVKDQKTFFDTIIFFEAWFEKHLIPLLKEGAVVVMDNALFHRKNHLNDIAKKYGIKIIFLPRIHLN